VLYAFREEGDLSEEMALKIACGLGAGMARKEEVCGAITGGILVLGLRYGRGNNDDRSAMELTYLKTRELIDLFSDKHGTFVCRELLNGCELTTEEGQKYFKENELLKKTCIPCVQSVIEILERIL
jgi:C_GCAxxG_C_C family probable redox protein